MADERSFGRLHRGVAGVRWIRFKAVWGGIAQVYLDGTPQAMADTYVKKEPQEGWWRRRESNPRSADTFAAPQLWTDGDREGLTEVDGQGRACGDGNVLSPRAGGDACADRPSDDGPHGGLLRASAQELAQEGAARGSSSDDPGCLLAGLRRDTGHGRGHRRPQPVGCHHPVERKAQRTRLVAQPLLRRNRLADAAVDGAPCRNRHAIADHHRARDPRGERVSGVARARPERRVKGEPNLRSRRYGQLDVSRNPGGPHHGLDLDRRGLDPRSGLFVRHSLLPRPDLLLDGTLPDRAGSRGMDARITSVGLQGQRSAEPEIRRSGE